LDYNIFQKLVKVWNIRDPATGVWYTIYPRELVIDWNTRDTARIILVYNISEGMC